MEFWSALSGLEQALSDIVGEEARLPNCSVGILSPSANLQGLWRTGAPRGLHQEQGHAVDA
jgi:hypothetical protein